MGQGPSTPGGGVGPRREDLQGSGLSGMEPTGQGIQPVPRPLPVAAGTAPQQALVAPPQQVGQPAPAPATTTTATASQTAAPARQTATAPSTNAATAAAVPAAGATGTAAAQTAGVPPARTTQRTGNLIPAWSKVLSSQTLQLEGQRIAHPNKDSAAEKDSYAVLDLEVMKYVAYCGGVMMKFRLEDPHGALAAAAPAAATPEGTPAPTQQSISWGLASTRPCAALANAAAAAQPPSSPPATSGPQLPTAQVTVGSSTANPTQSLSIENASRKPLYALCATVSTLKLSTDDVICIDLAPREGGQPVIIATLRVNGDIILQQYLPCSAISMLQMYPYLTLPQGMGAVLYEATTPSPLFTWYHSLGNPISEISLGDLDTTVKYVSGPVTPTHPQPPLGAQAEFLGSVTFASGRHRWTVQLDNTGALPTYVYVGIAHCSGHPTLTSASTSVLSNVQGPLRSIAGTSSTPVPALPAPAAQTAPAAAATSTASSSQAGSTSSGSQSTSQSGTQAMSTSSVAGGSPPPATSPAPAAASTPAATPPPAPAAAVPSEGPASASGPDAAAPGRARLSGGGGSGRVSATGIPSSPYQWGAWIRIPGAAPIASGYTQTPPQREGHVHHAEATTNHCFVTVDLDLNNGYVRFFRNGHLIGTAFQNVTGPVCPVLSLLQGVNVHCTASLVNITKLRQLDLCWTLESCSADLQLAGPVVSKVSEVYGDYSTVLADRGFTSGVHLWLIKINQLSEPDSIFIGVCRGCMPLDQDPQDLRDRTYYLSNGVIRVGGRRVATNAANFTKGDIVGVVLDADQGEIVFFRNGTEQGRARGIRGRLFPFVSCDSEGDQITLLGSYSLLLDRIPRQLADMEWDTRGHAADIELSSNCLTATKTSSNHPSTVHGTILYRGTGVHEFHVILDAIGPDGIWVGVAPPDMDASTTVGDPGCGWALHSDGDKRREGREEEYTAAFKSGDVLTVCVDLGKGTLRFSRNGTPLGEAFTGVTGPLVPAATLASEESKVTIQNRPTVLNTGEYTGELRWDEARAGKDLNVIDGLTVTKIANEGGDYATVLGTLCLASGQHSWNVYINHVEDSNLFIGVTVGGHDLNADPQEMKHRTYYLSNGTIRVAGKLITRCAEPYAEGDLVTVQLDMEARHVQFLKNGVMQGAGDGLPEEVWPYVSLDNIMDSVTLHSSSMFVDLVQSLRWNPSKACRLVALAADGTCAQLRPMGGEETFGQGTVLGLREYQKVEIHSWVVRLEVSNPGQPSNFLVGVAPPGMDLNKSLGEEGCGIGLDLFGYFYVNGKYFHVSNLGNWREVSKPVRGSTAKHKGKAHPVFFFNEGKCEVTMTLDLKEKTLKFAHAGRSIGIITDVTGPLHAAVTLTSSRQKASLAPGPIGKSEHTNEELVNILKGKGIALNAKLEAAMLLVPREVFVPRDRQREAFRDQKVTVRMADGSTMTLPPPSFVATALDKLGVGTTARSFLDVGCGTAYVTALAACLLADQPGAVVQGVECILSRLEAASSNMRNLRDRLANNNMPPGTEILGNPSATLSKVELLLANVLIPECTSGTTYDALFCDVAVTEEELPSLLSLLKPQGKLVCLIEEEAVLITRTGSEPHDFQREVIQHMQGDFGTLEDPTPWEVQEAILRIKERERKRGHDQAKSDVASLRNFEQVELRQRLQAAYQRITELEDQLKRTDLQAQQSLRSPARPPGPAAALTPEAFGSRSPSLTFVQAAATDDVRVAVKDKERRGYGLPKPSPRHSFGPASPMPSPGVNNSGDWKAMYTTDGGADAAAGPVVSNAKARARELLMDLDHSSSSEDQEMSIQIDDDPTEELEADDLLAGVATGAATPGADAGCGSPIHGSRSLFASGRLQLEHHEFENIIDSMSVQTFTPDQIAAMISGTEPIQIENRDVFQGTYKGVRVRVWRVNVSHGVSYIELKKAYSRYCIAHPNIAAVLGVCIQPSHTPAGALGHMINASASSPDLRRSASALPVANTPTHATPSMSPLSRVTYARSLPDSSFLAQPPAMSAQAAVAAALMDDTVPMASDSPFAEFAGDEPMTDAAGGAAASSRGVSPLGAAASCAADILSNVAPVQTSSYSATAAVAPASHPHTVWVVEESFGEESLHSRLERGMLSWQQSCRIATDICKALAFLQDLKRHTMGSDKLDADMYGSPGKDGVRAPGGADVVLSAYALRSIVTPANVSVNAQSTKVSVLPALLHHLEQVLGDPCMSIAPAFAPLHCDMAYTDPHAWLGEASSSPSFYAFGIVTLQLLTEQGPLGLMTAVKEALDTGTLMNLIPRLPVNAQMTAWAQEFAQLAIRCTQPGVVVALEAELLPALQELSSRLGALGTSAMSWEQVEELLMLPLQPRNPSDSAARRWVRQDFRMRRKLFLEEVAKLAVDGPVHRIDVRRARCFKDSIDKFAGKGHSVWRQPLKVSFLGEQGMDSGGVTREWFSALSSSISRGSPELFWAAGPQKNQLYINPLSSAPSHLKKFHFIGLFMAKAVLESSARAKELGPIVLNLPFCEPLWKLLLGIPLNLMDLQLLDPTEFRSLMTILDMDIDGYIFETFTWQFHQTAHVPAPPVSAAGFGVGTGYVAPSPSGTGAGGVSTPRAGAGAGAASPPMRGFGGESGDGAGASGAASSTPVAPASPMAAAEAPEEPQTVSIPLKPGGNHLKVTNHNKREYVLLKAHKMLVGTIEPQMTAIIDAFHSIIPRELIDKYAFTSLELQLLVCGEQRIDVQDLQRNCKYEDGYSGKEPVIAWFWEVVEGFDDTLRRQLLQFWSGSDGMPAEGFAAMDPAFHMVAVERLYDPQDTTARLPAAHTCFRQLDLPRYKSAEELKEKLVTAITIGQGYMALS